MYFWLNFSQLKSPGIVTMVNGSNKTLYMSTVQSIEAATRPNLKKTLRGDYQIVLLACLDP
jgi:E2 binding domain